MESKRDIKAKAISAYAKEAIALQEAGGEIAETAGDQGVG